MGAKLLIITIFLLVFGGFVYLVFLYERKERFRKVWQKLVISANFLLQRFKQPVLTPEKSIEIFEDIYAGLSLFGQKKELLLWLL